MAAAMCQALSSLNSDNKKPLFISVSNDFYEKTHDFFCSSGSCTFHLFLIETSLSQTLQKLDKYH